jgi:hypothetical protein
MRIVCVRDSLAGPWWFRVGRFGVGRYRVSSGDGFVYCVM